MDELNWTSIGLTSVLSFIGAFIGAYLSFHFKKKEKVFENKLEVEARIIDELKLPIYEMETNISHFKLHIKSKGINEAVQLILNKDWFSIKILQDMWESSSKINHILDLNSFYIKKNHRDIIMSEITKVRKASFFGSFYDNENFLSIYNETVLKEGLKFAQESLEDYDSKRLHKSLSELIK